MNKRNGTLTYIHVSANEEPEKMGIIQEELYIRIITQLIAFFKEKRWEPKYDIPRRPRD